jgi:Arc/MetJ family transcription regulator
MAKTLIDIDEDLLVEAGKVLGTSTKKDTVNASLAETVAQARRRRHLERLIGRGLPDLDDADVMEGAWR